MSDFKAKMHPIRFRMALRPRPRWVSLQRSPRIDEFKGLTSKGREGKGREVTEGRERKGKKGRGKGEGREEEGEWGVGSGARRTAGARGSALAKDGLITVQFINAIMSLSKV